MSQEGHPHVVKPSTKSTAPDAGAVITGVMLVAFFVPFIIALWRWALS